LRVKLFSKFLHLAFKVTQLSRLFCLILFILIGPGLYAQQLFTGIVVDSAKLTNLADVHISVKKSGKVTASSASGNFMIYAQKTDTLVFTAIGYVPTEIPLFFEEDVLFVMMREDRIWLNEVIIKSTRLYPNKIEERTKKAPRTMSALEGVFSPFDYFWSLEREKRKLTKIVEENNRTQTFRQVITDPDVKKIMMDEYEVTEETYYQLVVKFNQQQSHVHYFTDPDAIMEALHSFFEKSVSQ
jgi:hypothetical protein